MTNIKNFIDLVTAMEARKTRELVLSSTDAKMLRDEVAKLLADVIELRKYSENDQVISIDVSGGKW